MKNDVVNFVHIAASWRCKMMSLVNKSADWPPNYHKILIFFPTTSLKCLCAAKIDEKWRRERSPHAVSWHCKMTSLVNKSTDWPPNYHKILIFSPPKSLKRLRAARIDELADSNEPAKMRSWCCLMCWPIKLWCCKMTSLVNKSDDWTLNYHKILIFSPPKSLKRLRAARIDQLADSHEPTNIEECKNYTCWLVFVYRPCPLCAPYAPLCAPYAPLCNPYVPLPYTPLCAPSLCAPCRLLIG